MYTIFRGGNIGDGEYFYKGDDLLISKQFVKDNTILKKNCYITPSVTSIEHIGKIALIDTDLNKTVAGGFVLIVYPMLENDDLQKYYLYVLSSKYHKDNCKKITNKSGQAFYNLSREKLMQLILPLPPIEEQKRIAEKIKQFLPYIDNYNSIYNKIEILNSNYKDELKKSILQHAIQGKLVNQDSNDEPAEALINKILDEKRELIKRKQIKKENLSVIYKDSTDNQFYEKFDDGTISNITDEIPFEIPNNWCWTRLNNIVKSINAGGDKPKTFSKNITDKNTIPVISNGEKNEGVFGYTDKPVVCEKSLTISGRGTIGYSKIRIIPYVPIVRLLVLIPLMNTNLEYLQISIQALIEKGVGTAVKQLTVPMIKPKLIPIPPLSEQVKILKIINKFIEIIEK